MRIMGLGAAVDALDGETSKAYIGGVGMILSGGATLLGGAANLVMEIVPLHGGAAYVAFVQNLSHDANAALIMAGAGLIAKGLADIGQRHATAKLANFVASPSTPAPATPPQ